MTSPSQNSGVTLSRPPPYWHTNGDDRDDESISRASKWPIEKRQRSFSQRLFGLLHPHSEPCPPIEVLTANNVEVLVHETSPNIVDVVANLRGQTSSTVSVAVLVSATVTARSRHVKGRPAVASSKTCVIKRTAQEPYVEPTRDLARSVALATETATRKAADEAHEKAVALATVAATGKTLEKLAVRGRVR